MHEENIPINETDAELERLRRENEELTDRVRLRDARDTITAEMAAAGARSPELIFESVRGELRFGEDGRPENMAELMAGVRARFPEQFARGAPAVSADGASGTAAQPAVLTPEALGRMKPAEIARLDWTEVCRVLRGGASR